jgi:predicted enzyme related to lactoylglutathione lyase
MAGMPQLVWWEIETPNPDAFREFHTAMWGWTFAPAVADSGASAEYWVIMQDGYRIGGLQRAEVSSAPHPGTRIYFQVPDLGAALRRARDLGARTERGRSGLTGTDGWFATVVDPSGISIGLRADAD